jgi:hypothetical protein
MDKAKVVALRPEIETALADFAAKHGMSVHVGSGTYSEHNVVFKLEVAEKTETGAVMNREADDLVKRGELYLGVKIAVGQKFSYAGRKWEAIGLLPKSRKFPLVAKNKEGQIRKLPPHAVNPNWKPFPFPRFPRFED